MKVVWYIPNIIDYFRIFFLLVSLQYFETDMTNTLIFYSLSCSMDMFDGYTARIFNQSSLFGGILDMVTDRMSTIVFIIYLSKLYSQHVFIFSLILYLDIISHWMQMVATFMKGKTNHKQQDFDFQILALFYNSRLVLTLLCIGNEGFFVNLYIKAMATYQPIININQILIYINFPLFLIKQFIHAIQLAQAAKNLILLDRDSYINK